MPTIPTSTEALPPFFGYVTATADFRRKYGVYYSRESNRTGAILLAERPASGPVRVFAWHFLNGLRLLQSADLRRLGGSDSAAVHDLDGLALDALGTEEGQLVYRMEYDDEHVLASLDQFAAHAVRERGATPATARWMMMLVELAFGGPTGETSLSDRGILLPHQSFRTSADTFKRQLKQLQAAGALVHESERGSEGYHIKFNRQFLTPLNFGLAPAFFQAFTY